MAKVFSAKNSYIQRKRTQKSSASFLLEKRLEGNVRISAASMVFVVFTLFLATGFFYLYQVNDLATKGYEIKEIENRIKDLEEEGKKLKIKETELRSMYTIEKDTENLNLVNSENISYIEVNGPVALK